MTIKTKTGEGVPMPVMAYQFRVIFGGTLIYEAQQKLTKNVEKEEVGGILGISSSFESLTRVIAPSLGGLLLGSLGTWAPGVAGAVIMFGVIILAWVTIFNQSDDQQKTAELN